MCTVRATYMYVQSRHSMNNLHHMVLEKLSKKITKYP